MAFNFSNQNILKPLGDLLSESEFDIGVNPSDPSGILFKQDDVWLLRLDFGKVYLNRSAHPNDTTEEFANQ
jgi:hypothetical protein